jgi:hypothetical protein
MFFELFSGTHIKQTHPVSGEMAQVSSLFVLGSLLVVALSASTLVATATTVHRCWCWCWGRLVL